MSARTLITVGITTALLSLASCGSDEPEPIPEMSTTPTPSVSPPPAAPDLTEEEQAAYEQAVDDYEEGQNAIAEASYAHPTPDKTTEAVLNKYTFSPARNNIAKDIVDRQKLNIRLSGSRDTAWTVPVKIDLDNKTPTIEWLRCLTPGDLKVVRDGKEVAQKNTNTLLRITSNLDPDQFWRMTRGKEAGSC